MPPSTLVRWLGSPPSRAAALSLDRAGIRVTRSVSTSENEAARIVFTASSSTAPPSPGPDKPWLWVSDRPAPAVAVKEAVLHGAYDVISLSESEAAQAIAKRIGELQADLPQIPPTDAFGGQSEVSRQVLERVVLAARTSMPVLLTGETGTGKEVCARLIHNWSPRAARRMVTVNCAAIPNELMEAELFGYARGAFTGAVQKYDGQLMAAEGGTVFLDEIDDTPLSIQAKLLRVLDDRVVSRLGENQWHEVDFRIIAATNRDLKPLIRAGQFGADLYERLAIVSIHLPPLRERLEDLSLLVEHFIERFYDEEASSSRERVHGIGARALELLRAYPWPGNVRELRNVIFETLVVKRAGDEILVSDLPRRVLGGTEAPRGVVDVGEIRRRLDAGAMNLRAAVDELERLALCEALGRSGGNATKAAQLLVEVGRGASSDPGGTVRAMMRRLGLGRPRRSKRAK